MKRYAYILYVLLFISCQQVIKGQEAVKERVLTKEQQVKQDSIIEKYAVNDAHKYSYEADLDKWQEALDRGLEQDSTIAYLWQQKAMPYFKSRKYEVGMEYVDKAVQYDVRRYLPYRAFIKCVFSKNYKEAIVDFEECLTRWGDSYEMDHTYTFYIGLSYLQLNEFDKAEQYFLRAVDKQKEVFQDIHHVDLFYLGIVCFEQKRYQEAIAYFDKAIAEYKEFSDAYYYKGITQYKMKDIEATRQSLVEFDKYQKMGYSINEANAIYEPYPYQVRKN